MQALKFINSNLIFILVDLNFSGLSGYDICHILKNQVSTASIRIIAVTADWRQSCIDKIMSMGADMVLEKPMARENVTNARQLIFAIEDIMNA